MVTGAAGFGEATQPEPTLPAPWTQVASSGFEITPPAAPAAGAAKPTGPPDSPVEVEFKPTPAYSAEARDARIEGTVALDVEFSASGTVHVIRVIEGLGYGLDDLAVSAAEQMRFSPAVRNGQRVDTRAVVHIVFRMT